MVLTCFTVGSRTEPDGASTRLSEGVGASLGGSLLGRKATKYNGMSKWLKMAKVSACIAVVGTLLLHYYSTPATALSTSKQAPESLPNQLVCPVDEIHKGSTKLEFLSRHMHPGLQIIKKMGAGCQILSNNLFTLKSASQCETDITDVLKRVGAKDGSLDSLFSEKTYRNRGRLVTFDPTRRDLYVAGINPEIKASYRSALRKTYLNIVYQPDFFNRTSDEILETFKTIHNAMIKHDPDYLPGQYRVKCSYIFPNYVDLTGRTDSQKTFDQLLGLGFSESKINEGVDALNAALQSDCKLPDWARNMWSKVIGLPCAPSEIPGKMMALIERLKNMVANQENPVGIATTAHTELVNIHPWRDGNGRFARMIMNAILAMYGHEPVIFPTRAAYNDAVLAESTQPGAFERFLSDDIIPWNQEARAVLNA